MSLPAPDDNDKGEGRYPVTEPPRRKWKIVAAVIASLVVVALVGAGLYVSNLRTTFDENRTVIPQAFPSERPSPSLKADYNGYTFLLIGSDSRISIDSNDGGDQRADTMMLVNIPTDRSKVYVTSVMRDTYVPIPGHGEGKINSALSLGGIPLLVETIETLTDARIDHVASVDFEGFRELTESIGGVTVENATEFTAHDGDYYPAGTLELEGDYALNYVRERKAFADSDFQRVRNQQDFLRAVFTEVTSAGVLSNPVKLQNMVKSFSPYVTTDRDLTAEATASIAISLKDLASEDIISFTMDNAGVSETIYGESIILADLEAFASYGEAVNSDTMYNYEEFALPELGTAAAAQDEIDDADAADDFETVKGATDGATGTDMGTAEPSEADGFASTPTTPVAPVDPAAPVAPAAPAAPAAPVPAPANGYVQTYPYAVPVQ